MSKYYGNILEDATIELTFNTFNSDGASVTVTDLADSDIKVHKDGHVDQIATDGATVVIDFDGITGNHVITIDTSVDAAYTTGSNYEVRLEGITVDSQTINAFVGSFSIDNRAADITQISGDATAADNLEATYDGEGYIDGVAPATQDQVQGIGSTGGSLNQVAGSFTLTAGEVVSGTYASTFAEDQVYHQIGDDSVTDDIDMYYEFDVGNTGVGSGVNTVGRINSGNDDLTMYAWNWTGTPAWDVIRSYDGKNGSTDDTRTAILTSAHTGTGSDIGKIRIRYAGSGLTTANLYVDQISVSYSVIQSATGYANGAVWVDSAGDSGTVPHVNGTADNPCPWADAIVIAPLVGLDRFHIANDNSIELTAGFDDKTMYGEHYYLDLSGESINDSYFSKATIVGAGTAANHVVFEDCEFGASTIPPCKMVRCGIGLASGAFVAASAGDFTFIDCFSLVPGSGSPSLTFQKAATTGINNRRWAGGATYALDGDCTLSHEVVAGGGTTITTGGAAVEIRGVTRSITLEITGTSNNDIQFVGTTGPIAISGTASGDCDINLYGVSSSVTDTSSNAGTLTDRTINPDSIPDFVWDEPLTGSSHNDPTSAGKRLRQINAPVLLDGTSPGSNASTYINLDGDASAVDGTYDPGVISIYEGTGAGQSRQIFEYDGTLKRAYINRDWKVTPSSDSKYLLTANSGDTHVNEGKAQGGGASTITLNELASDVDDVYNEQTVFIVAGLGADQSRVVSDYDGDTQIATVDHAWDITPDTTSIYAMLPITVHSVAEIQSGLATEAKQDIMQTAVDDIPNTSEFEARTIVAADYFDPDNDPVANVTLVDTTTENTDMVGTDDAATEAKQDIIDTNIDRISAIQESDKTFDPTAGTLTYQTKGTSTAIMKKGLKDPDGNAVNSTEDIIATERDMII